MPLNAYKHFIEFCFDLAELFKKKIKLSADNPWKVRTFRRLYGGKACHSAGSSAESQNFLLIISQKFPLF
jgi:hypothetical protein